MQAQSVSSAPLVRLADKIRGDLSRRTESREQWIEATLDLCIHLAEARAQFKADIEFGQWCGENGFGDNVLNKDDRAAAIAMGGHLDETPDVLQLTDRRSLQHIYRHECRFRHATKPARATKKKSTKPHRKVSPEQAT